MIRRYALLFCVVSALAAFAADDPKPAPPYEAAVDAARSAEKKGLMGQALEHLERAETIDPKRVEAWFIQGRVLAAQRKSGPAILSFSKAIEIEPKASTAYNLRGWEFFKENKIDKAIADFNKYIELEPQQAPYHWQRGIALYEAGRFAEGRKQFELHQTVNSHDVENAVWHFLCVARNESVEKARAALIPITGDQRVPMAEVYELFAGKMTPDDVLKATKKGSPTAVQLEDREFYAHLYLGLYYEATGDAKKAFDEIKTAATNYGAEHYMGDVARVHLKRLLQNPPK